MKYKIITGSLALIILTAAYFLPQGQESVTPDSPDTSYTALEATQTPEVEALDNSAEKPAEEQAENLPEKSDENTKGPEKTVSVDIQAPTSIAPDKKSCCTLLVSCDTILQNMTRLDSEKKEIIPSDGIIFPEKSVSFTEGESVFDILLREMKNNKIHLEFVKTPVYDSVYIEGIANIYEFDCGELSGWMYSVNGVFPSYSSSVYFPKDGDRIKWLYSCDLGRDIGGGDSAGRQQ